MSPETKVVKGGFRATRALILSIIALLVAVAAFNRAGGNLDMSHQMGELKTTIENLKQDTSQQLNNVRQETGKAIQSLGKQLEGEQKNQQPCYQKSKNVPGRSALSVVMQWGRKFYRFPGLTQGQCPRSG